MMHKSIIIVLIILCVSQLVLCSGERTNVQSLGMARTSTAVARGIDAVGINPANQAYTDIGTLTFNLLNFGLHIGTDFFDKEMYNKYFVGNDTGGAVFLIDKDKKRIMKIFSSSLAHSDLDFEIKLFSISFQIPPIGGFAVCVIERAGFNLKIPKDYFELILYGNPLNKRFNFSKTYLNGLWYREYSLSYGRQIPKFSFLKSMSAGISFKLLDGYATAYLAHNDSYFQTDANGKLFYQINFNAKAAGIDIFRHDSVGQNYSLFPKPAGSGFGIDIGISGFVNEELSFGISFVDVGSINWKRNSREISTNSSYTIDDPFLGNQLDTLKNIFVVNNRSIAGFKSSLPSALRFGVAYQFEKSPFAGKKFPGELLIAIDYHQGLNNTAGNTTTPRFSIGVEYKPLKWLPLRTGLSVGGTDRLNLGFGFGIMFRSFNLEFASENFGAVFTPNDIRRLSFACGMRIRI